MKDWAADVETIRKRLEVLEKQNRRLRQLASVVLLVVSMALLMGQAEPSRTIKADSVRAQEIVIEDASGRERASLRADVNSTELTLLDSEGDPVATLGEYGQLGPFLHLELASGGELTLGGLGASAWRMRTAALRATDADKRVLSGFSPHNVPSLVINSGKGGVAELGVEDRGGWLTLKAVPTVTAEGGIVGLRGERGVQLVTQEDVTMLTLRDGNKFEAVIGNTELGTRTGESRKTSAASVVLVDGDGRVLWRAP